MSNDTQESTGSRPRPYPSVITPIQIERLKREDEEEHWISGEELYTEGSSEDEEDQRSLIIETGISNAESIRQPGAGRSKWSHPRSSSQNLSSGTLRQKVKTYESDSSGNSIIFPPAIIKTGEKPSSSISENEHPEIGDMVSGKIAENLAHNVDDEDDDLKEISWRPKRDDNYFPSLISKDSAIVELRELQFEYDEILDTLSELKTSLTTTVAPLNIANSRKRCDNNYYENENSLDLIETILQLQQSRESTTTAAKADEEIIKDVSFSDQDVDRWSNAIIYAAKIKKEILKIMKLDTCIEELEGKFKKASKETFQEQITNRKELRRLQSLRSMPESGKLARNSTLFFKLCSMEIESVQDKDISSAYTIHPIISIENEPEIRKYDEEDVPTPEDEEEARKSRREKLEEQLKMIDKRKANFIERNKKLASCTMGTLAITDEEKKRLEKLMEDTDDEDFETDGKSTADSSSTAPSTPYTIGEEADKLLKKLTEQLANINSEHYRKAEEEQYTRKEFHAQKEQMVLNSLRTLTESKSKIIFPISEDEMKQLINEYYAEQEVSSFRSFMNGLDTECFIDSKLEVVQDHPTSGSIDSGTCTITQDVINELVNEAKITMPFFQFKNQTQSIESVDDKGEDYKVIAGIVFIFNFVRLTIDNPQTTP